MICHLLKAPPPNAITLSANFKMSFIRDTSIQIIACTNNFKSFPILSFQIKIIIKICPNMVSYKLAFTSFVFSNICILIAHIFNSIY
jgi:hypothetical protein